MKYAVDLHIHSALSPCSDSDMTPNNIVNMACLKGLDIIAVTDHNSAENLASLMECAGQKSILFIPGMEIETKEEVHLVCLFPGIREAVMMQDIVYSALPDMENREDIFGEQLIIDEKDNITGYCKRMLITATGLGIDEVFKHVKTLSGVVIPAHVDRESYSILSNLGLIPENLNIRYVEISKNCDLQSYKDKNPHINGFGTIKSSDAHQLKDILEREVFIELEDISIDSVLNFFGRNLELIV